METRSTTRYMDSYNEKHNPKGLEIRITSDDRVRPATYNEKHNPKGLEIVAMENPPMLCSITYNEKHNPKGLEIHQSDFIGIMRRGLTTKSITQRVLKYARAHFRRERDLAYNEKHNPKGLEIGENASRIKAWNSPYNEKHNPKGLEI